MQLLWASMVPKDLDLGTKAVGQVQKVEQGAKPKLVAARKPQWWLEPGGGTRGRAVGDSVSPCLGCYPQRCAKPAGRCRLLSHASPTSGLSQVGKTGNGKGKGKGKGGLKEKREATKLLWEQATEDQQKLLEAAGLRQPVEAKPELKELCKKFEDSLPVELQEALRALDPKPDPRKELKEANLEYKQATMDLRKLINRKAMLQHEINKAKEGYQALLQSMQDLKVEEKVQQEKVQKLQKTLHERVADGEEESTCEELDLQAAMTSAGVDLTKEQKEALARALGQKPVKVAFAFGLDAATPDRKPGSETGNDRKPRSRSPKRDRMED